MAEEPCTYEGCQEPRWGGGATCIFHSEDPNKDVAEFECRLSNKGDCNYRGFIFPQGFKCSWRELSEDMDFSYAQVKGGADFHLTRFLGRATFFRTSFHGKAVFNGASFEQGASFYGVVFAGGAQFLGVSFKEMTDFSMAAFYQEAAFGRARFPKGVAFEETTLPLDAEFFQTSFSNALFRDLSLRRCHFRDATGLEESRFENVDWGTAPKCVWRWQWPQYLWRHRLPTWLIRRRSVIGDELMARAVRLPRYYSGAERAYHQLLKTYESQRDFPEAEDFHYGEMEMRRLRGFQPILTLYGAVNGYGHSWPRAFAWLLLLVLLCAFVYGWSGLQAIGSPSPDWVAANSAYLFPPYVDWGTFLRSLTYSVRSAVLQPERSVQPASDIGLAVQAFEFVMGPILIALTGLALRRKFKR